MKKQLSLFTWAAAVFGMAALFAPLTVVAATNSGAGGASVTNLSDGPDKKAGTQVTEYKKYETRTSTATYSVQPRPTTAPISAAPARDQNLYYVAPNRRDTTDYTAPAPASAAAAQVAAKKVTERKYYLAHPFFQPEGGKFGSLTDLGYNWNSYNFAITGDPTPGASWDGLSGKWSANQLTIKQDFSYGITDRVAIIGSGRYSSSRYKFTWNPPVLPPDDVDKMSNSQLDVLGLGMQWRFYDDAEWIAYVGAYYQWWNDLANVIAADAKVGYKINSNSTVYGLGRLYYMSWEGNSYGNGITNDGGQSLYIAYKNNVDSSIYAEIGAGFFTVLADDWTLNLEGVIGSYEWHTQGSIKAAFGWQPTKSFALNLYAKTAVFDTANSAKGLKIYTWDAVTPVTFEGDVSLSKYSETSIGIQAMLYF